LYCKNISKDDRHEILRDIGASGRYEKLEISCNLLSARPEHCRFEVFEYGEHWPAAAGTRDRLGARSFDRFLSP
jgi:hypothetical protein